MRARLAVIPADMVAIDSWGKTTRLRPVQERKTFHVSKVAVAGGQWYGAFHGHRSDPNVISRNGCSLALQSGGDLGVIQRSGGVGMQHGHDLKERVELGEVLSWEMSRLTIFDMKRRG
jgi:hypothetical protein